MMAIAAYIGIVERAGDGLSVYFPDLPGCVSAGQTFVEACSNAEEALAAHLELLLADGEELPPASPEVAADEDSDVVAAFLARAALPGKAVRINISMDEGLIERIDRVANNRSAFLAEAAREALARQRDLEPA